MKLSFLTTSKVFLFAALIMSVKPQNSMTSTSMTTTTGTTSTTTMTMTMNDPSGALGPMTTTYTAKGTESKIDDLPIYTVGTGSKAVVFVYDIYGFNGGRTREICDGIAAKGYFVILPDFYRGDYSGKAGSTFSTATYTWDKINDDLTKKVYPYLEGKKFTNWSIIGACWGGWVALEASRYDKVVGGISYHPSVNNRLSSSLDTFPDLLKAPQLVITSKSEPAELKPNGVFDTKLKTKFNGNSQFKAYEDMAHGFVPRGDLTQATVKTAVDESIQMTYNFLAKVAPVSNLQSPGSSSGSFSLSVLLAYIISFLLVIL